jgi:hypothetical protein
MKFFDIVDTISEHLFYMLSYFRGKRIFHPTGTVYVGTLTIANKEDLPTCSLFQKSQHYQVIIRLSRGVGFPEPLPDILGFAMRIVDAYGPELHQDILMVTCGRGIFSKYGMFFRFNFFSSFFSTILSYKIGQRKYLFGIIPSGKDSSIFTFGISSPLGHWSSIGKIELGEVASEHIVKELRYNPWNTGSDMQPFGFLQRLRKNAYRASQRGRAKRIAP